MPYKTEYQHKKIRQDELDRQKFKERQKTGIYYKKEKQREYSKKLRQRRKELNLQNKLV